MSQTSGEHMKIGVSLKIDVKKIDRSRLFKGEKGTYLDCTAFIELDEVDQYGQSGMITQDTSKEEKEQGIQGAILGNSKIFWTSEKETQNKNDGFSNDFGDDIEF